MSSEVEFLLVSVAFFFRFWKKFFGFIFLLGCCELSEASSSFSL